MPLEKKAACHMDWDADCKLWVGNLGEEGNRLELEEAFSKIGPCRNIWVAKNPPSFAYIEMEDPRDAEDAIKALDGTEICGMRARVEMAKARDDRRAAMGASDRGPKHFFTDRRGVGYGPRPEGGSSRSRDRSRDRTSSSRRDRSRSRDRRRDRSRDRSRDRGNSRRDRSRSRDRKGDRDDRRSADRDRGHRSSNSRSRDDRRGRDDDRGGRDRHRDERDYDEREPEGVGKRYYDSVDERKGGSSSSKRRDEHDHRGEGEDDRRWSSW